MAYHYQCASRYCTLRLETAENDEPVYSDVDGDACSSCQSRNDAQLYDDDDDCSSAAELARYPLSTNAD
jgi:hypothetical protein